MRIPTSIGTLLLCALASGCATPPPSAPRETDSPRGPSVGKVRVGAVLRLARAGVIEEVRGTNGRTEAVVLVPSARGSTAWQRAVDTQGNQFQVAPGGRMVTPGEPQPDQEPASEANVAYYFAQSLALMASRYRRQGLAMAAEVLDLPSQDPVVRIAQRRLCVLFSRVGLGGNILEQLYLNLGAVPHRVGGGVEVRNHVHRFLARVPLDWKLLAGSVPDLGPRATGLVFALPRGWGGRGDGQANLLWVTTKAPSQGDLATWIPSRRLITAASQTVSFPLTSPPGVSEMTGQRVAPLDYQRRTLRSWQVFFVERDVFHHLALLAPLHTEDSSARPVLEALLSSFQVGRWGSVCQPDSGPTNEPPRQSGEARL